MALPTTSADAQRERLISIQYIRALAAVVVIVWHTGWSYTVLGQSGVDLFFVVSGFVMMLVSQRERAPSRFMVARLLRIAPLYWGVTLIVASIDHSAVSKVITSLLFLPDGKFPVILAGWSLNLEMLYYVLFAVAVTTSTSSKRLALLGAEILILCLVVRVVWSRSDAVTTLTNPLAVEFLAGTCLYAVWHARLVPTGVSAWVLGFVGAAALALTHKLGGAPDGWMRVLFWGVPATAIIAGGLGIERAGQLPRIRLLGILGEASYSIYLTHLFALSLVAWLLSPLWAPVAVMLAVLWTCTIGWIVHRLVELPLHNATSRWLRQAWPNSGGAATPAAA